MIVIDQQQKLFVEPGSHATHYAKQGLYILCLTYLYNDAKRQLLIIVPFESERN